MILLIFLSAGENVSDEAEDSTETEGCSEHQRHADHLQ